jgi:imidazolonepropionase-like amidohydrolase
MVAYGLPPLDALKAATSGNAAMLGLDDRGVIAAGKRADVVAVAGDPSNDIEALNRPIFVMKSGRVYRRP